MILGGDRDERAAADVLAALVTRERLDDRLDAVLDAAGDAAGVPARYVYLTAADGRRLHLSRGRPVASDVGRVDPDWARPDRDGGLVSQPSGEGAAPAPPLELSVERAAEERTMPTPGGPMHALPLVLGAEIVGLVLLGPLGDGGGLGGRARRRLAALVPALATVARQARREHVLREEVTALTSREEVGRRLSGSTLEVDGFVTMLLDLALRSTRTAAGFVAVVDPATGRLEIRARAGLPEGFVEPDLSPERGVFDWDPAGWGGALGLRDLDWAAANGIASILAVPLAEGDAPLGVFALVNFDAGHGFTDGNLSLLGTYAEQIRLMLDNARLFADFSRRYLTALRGLAASLDARRPQVADHHGHVEGVARAVAHELGAGPAELRAVAQAAAIHDIGLLAMTDTEAFAADQEHPLIGAAMVEHLPVDPAMVEAIATHHEWYDGWGFPRGLRGEQVGRPGRVLATAEFVVELVEGPGGLGTVDGPRLATELRLRRGSQLDPAATDAALRLLETGRLPLEIPGPPPER